MLIATSGYTYTREQAYNDVRVRSGEQLVRLNVRNEVRGGCDGCGTSCTAIRAREPRLLPETRTYGSEGVRIPQYPRTTLGDGCPLCQRVRDLTIS
jgi:hypothetical protein